MRRENGGAQKWKKFGGLSVQGIRRIEGEFFSLFILPTLTQLRFILMTQPSFDPMLATTVLGRIYEEFSSHVIKDPFVRPSLDNPVKSKSFDEAVASAINELCSLPLNTAPV